MLRHDALSGVLRMTDIFLSYSEKDRETARRVAAFLEAAGWSVWWDRRIPAGESWRSVLDDALRSMRCMVVLWSEHSVQSEWVCEEASEGRRLDKLVPVLIDRVRPPAGFREIQAADLVGWDGSAAFPAAQELVRDLADRLGKPPPSDEARARPAAAGTEAGGARAVAPEGREALATSGAGPRMTPAGHGDRLWRFAPWGVAAALALAAASYFLFTQQARRDAATPGTRVPPATEYAAPARQAPGEKVKVAPDVDRVQRPPDVRESPAPAAVAVPTPAPATGSPPRAKEVVRERVAPRTTETSPPELGGVGAARTPRTPAGSASSAAAARCSDLLQELQLGEVLSEEKQAWFDRECKR